MLWVDKHRPNSLSKLIVHAHVGAQLKGLAEGGELPHLLLYGPTGAGKKTLTLSLLRELYGPAADKLKVRHQKVPMDALRVCRMSTLSLLSRLKSCGSHFGTNILYDNISPKRFHWAMKERLLCFPENFTDNLDVE